MVLSTVIVSAPGKVILHGEHSIVYGGCALVCAIDKRCTVAIDFIDGSQFQLQLPNLLLNEVICWDLSDLQAIRAGVCDAQGKGLEAQCALLKPLINSVISDSNSRAALTSLCCLLVFLQYWPSSSALPSLKVQISSLIPVGAGLGSSAAMSVAITAAFATIAGELTPHCASWDSENRDLVNVRAFECERLFHGQPSGVDNTTSTFGGALIFNKSTNAKKLVELRMPKNCRILLVNTQVPRQTTNLVKAVARLCSDFPDVTRHIMLAIETLVERAQCLLVRSSCSNMSETEVTAQWQQLIRLNQHLLASLGVSHTSIDAVVTASEKIGGAAKLTGAGGGGCVLVCLSETIQDDEFRRLLPSSMDLNCEALCLGVEGVRLDMVR